MACVLHFAIL
jgi:hypothetical protein